jgi:hypothetical protein
LRLKKLCIDIGSGGGGGRRSGGGAEMLVFLKCL